MSQQLSVVSYQNVNENEHDDDDDDVIDWFQSSSFDIRTVAILSGELSFP